MGVALPCGCGKPQGTAADLTGPAWEPEATGLIFQSKRAAPGPAHRDQGKYNLVRCRQPGTGASPVSLTAASPVPGT